MIEKPSIPDQHIINCLRQDYGIEIKTLVFLPLGADINAAVYKAQAQDQSLYFIKVIRGKQQHTIVSLLHDAGIKEIILPVKTPTQMLDEYTVIVSPFIEGKNGFEKDLTETQWITLGKAMRQVHDIKVPNSIKAIIRRETFSPKWREAVRELYPHIEIEKNDTQAIKLQTFMRQHIETIHQLVDRAEKLSKQIQKLNLEYVLCHSDIHGGNVLIDAKDKIYIVDWDDPIMAPKERDLMFIGGEVANVWNKPHEEKFFYQGYGSAKVNPQLIAYYRYERIVEDIALLGQQLLLSTTGGVDRAVAYQHFVAQFELNGVVEIALKNND